MKRFLQFGFVAVLAGVLLATMVPGASAAFVHDELSDGDLPGDVAAAPLLQTRPGSNKARALTGPAAFDERDLFELVLPSGGELVGIVIDGYATVPSNPGTSFLLVAASGAFVGGLQVSPATIGRDVLVNFTSFINQENSLRFAIVESGAPAQLQVDFVVTPIPPAAAMLATALVALATVRRRRP